MFASYVLQIALIVVFLLNFCATILSFFCQV